MYLIRKVEKNLTLQEWSDIIDSADIFLSSHAIAALDEKISEDEIISFLSEKNISDTFYANIFPYLTKNFKNISRYHQAIEGWRKNTPGSNFLRSEIPNSVDSKFIEKHMSSIFHTFGTDAGVVIVHRLRQNPEKNIYDLYREMASKFLQKTPEIDENIRLQNNQKLLHFQQNKLNQKEIENAKKI